MFDGIAVCSGPFNDPRYPTDLLPSDAFSGNVHHSADYKDPTDFLHHDSILVVGGGNSAIDITLDLYGAGKKLTLLHRKDEHLLGFPEDIAQITDKVKSVDGNYIEFHGGKTVKASAILLCTGYDTDVSFLHESCDLSVMGDVTIHPLYKYFINPHFPSMSVFSRMLVHTPFILSQYQALGFAKILDGSVSLPSKEEMVKSAYQCIDKHTNPRKHYEVPNHMSFYREMGELCDSHFIDYEMGAQLHNQVIEIRNRYPMTYRDLPDSYWTML